VVSNLGSVGVMMPSLSSSAGCGIQTMVVPCGQCAPTSGRRTVSRWVVRRRADDAAFAEAAVRREWPAGTAVGRRGMAERSALAREAGVARGGSPGTRWGSMARQAMPFSAAGMPARAWRGAQVRPRRVGAGGSAAGRVPGQ
jgi:hypothetical protein